jgi:predicted nucleic acid-binding protein
MKVVIDASMALAWIYKRPTIEEATCADEFIDLLFEAECFVPSLWHTELTNSLLTLLRQKAASEAQVLEYLNKIEHLPIIADEVPVVSRREAVMALAREHGLTTYDATYLELALRNNAILATFDKKLAKAMRNAGGTVYGDT